MSRVEKFCFYLAWAIVLTVFALTADNASRRIKALAAKCGSCGKCDCLSAVLPELEREEACRKADRDDIQQQLDKLKKQCAACSSCCCTKGDTCPASCKCGCPADGCPCVKGMVRCKSRACKCRKACCDQTPLPKFDHFAFIQIYNDCVWFGWVDADGGEHETRMTLEEFERWGDEGAGD